MPPGPTYYLYLVECIELVDAAFMRATMSVGNPARPYDVADHLFFKLQSATPGALSESVEVVKKIVEKHGGVLQYQTRMNHGTTFGVVLPLADDQLTK